MGCCECREASWLSWRPVSADSLKHDNDVDYSCMKGFFVAFKPKTLLSLRLYSKLLKTPPPPTLTPPRTWPLYRNNLKTDHPIPPLSPTVTPNIRLYKVLILSQFDRYASQPPSSPLPKIARLAGRRLILAKFAGKDRNRKPHDTYILRGNVFP